MQSGVSYVLQVRSRDWLGGVSTRSPAALRSIRVRDPEGRAYPSGTCGSCCHPSRGKGYDRTNYVERMCDTPLKHDFGVSPEWPFVAASGGFEQPVGTLRPPIVVDWAKGKITALLGARDGAQPEL